MHQTRGGELQTLSCFNPRQLELLPASDANSQSVTLGVCLGAVTAMAGAVHRLVLSCAHLIEAESSSRSSDTGVSGVHRLGEGGAPPWAPPPLSVATAALFPRATEARLVTAMVTAMVMAVHRLFFLERREIRELI